MNMKIDESAGPISGQISGMCLLVESHQVTAASTERHRAQHLLHLRCDPRLAGSSVGLEQGYEALPGCQKGS